MEYSLIGYRKTTQLVRLDVLINGERIDDAHPIVHSRQGLQRVDGRWWRN